MKMIIMIILSLLVYSLSFFDSYSLTAGIPINIPDSENGDIYYFTIKSSEYSKLTISFTMSNIYRNPFSYIEMKDSSTFGYDGFDKWESLTISTKETNSDLIISASYTVDKLDHIFFRIKLTSNIKAFTVKVDEEIRAYELINDTKKLNYLLSDTSYYFYRNASIDLKINFHLTMDYLDTDPIKNIFIYELRDWGYNNLIKNTSQTIKAIKQGNKLLISFSYIVSDSITKSVGIVVKTSSKEIYNVEVKMDLLAEFYDLENRKSLTVQNLIPEKNYFFFVNAELYSEIEFSINMDKINGNPFNNTGILRYKNSDNLFNQFAEFVSYKYNTTIKENKLKISLHYSVSKYETQKIGLKLQPLSNINYINIQVDVEGGLYELIDGSSYISNLMANTSYYFYTDALFAHTLNISFTMNSSSSAPFSSINIYESSEIKDVSRLKTSTIPASIKKKDDLLFTSFSYSGSKDYCKYIFIEIRPSSIIDSLTAKIVKNVEFNNLIINKPKTFYNLSSEKFYYFNMKIEGYSKVIINITLDKVYDNPFDYFYLYNIKNEIPSFSEFSRISKYNKLTQKIDNKSVITIIYKSENYGNNYNNYISNAIKPLYNFNSININIIQEKQSYEIIDCFSQNLTNLLVDNTYYFFYTKNNINLEYDFYFAMNYTEKKPFNFLNLQNGNAYHTIRLNEEMKKINNEWVVKYSFGIPAQISSDFLYLSITPEINIDYMYTGIDVYNSKIQFDSDSGTQKINANSGEKYYLTIKSQYNKKIIINFIMDIIYNNSFSSVNIYEYNDLINPYYNKKSTINIKEKIKGNKIEIPISYTVVNTSTKYTFIEFIPKKQIHKMIINLINEKNENNDFKAYYIIIPLIIIVVIIVIIFIIIWVKRKNKVSSDIIENNTQQPLFSIPETN